MKATRKMLQRSTLSAILACLWLAIGHCAFAQSPPAAPQTEAGLIAIGAKKLGATDFEALYLGNTLTGKSTEGDDFHVFLDSRSTYRMEFQGKRTSDTWSVGQDGAFCTIADKETICTREYLHEKTIYSFNADGSLTGTAQIRPGNPEKL
jgi:hypothetical protein